MRTITELRERRIFLGISQRALAREPGCSQANLWRIEANASGDLSVVRVAEIASILGLEISLGLHELGDPIRDKGQQAVGKRFDALVSEVWRSTAEMLLPMPGDRRAWDRLLRLAAGPDAGYLVGVDIETRIRDMQALVRRTRERERDGHVDAILIVLSDSSVNRRLVDELQQMLGPAYVTAPREILAALRRGEPLPGSGVILV